MKRDLKINYGVLDDIIDELQKYDNALQTMEGSLEVISALVKTNEGESVEAWDHHIRTSKDEIGRYQKQMTDLLSLFENYVTDTTALISPLERNTMMRVSRNNIWANLGQIEVGLTGHVIHALMRSNQPPTSFLFGLFDDPTDAEKEASAYNKNQMGLVQENIKSTQTTLHKKMEELWELYHTKVKPFENTDDDYKALASKVKKDYTDFFEGIIEGFQTFDQAMLNITRGFVNGVIAMVSGIVTIAGDVGIIAVSALIPDPIEPELIKKTADETFDGYKQAAIQLIQDPVSVVGLVAQTASETVEEEGFAYLTGGVLTTLIPASGVVKLARGGSKVKGPGKSKVNDSPYSKEFLQGKIDAAKAGLADVRVPVFTKEKLSTGSSEINSFGMEMKQLGDVHPQMFKGRSNGKDTDNTSVTNKSNLYRGDSLLYSPTRPNGIGKPYISNSGDLVPASKDGLYKGRQVTVTEHILGGYRKGAKSNSPYTSFTNNKNVIGNYGENTIELDISALRKDIQSGKVKDVVILSPKQIQKIIERDVVSSDFWKNRAINWTRRDNEYLIKGEVPSQYIKVSPKE